MMIKRGKISFLATAVFILFGNTLFAQTGNNKKLLERARNNFLNGDYFAAIQQYRALLKSDSTDVEYNYELAQTYFFSDSLKLKSIPYFERTQKTLKSLNQDTLVELYYYLGKTYQLANRFEDAITSYKKYLQLFKHETTVFSRDDEEGSDLVREVERNIMGCKSARAITQRPVNKIEMNGKLKEYEISNLGENINSKFDDYGTVISPDDSVLYFTSRRKSGKKSKKDDDEEKYYEDIYQSRNTENGWGSATPVGKPINTNKGNEAINFVSSDGYRIYFCRGNRNGTFYSSDRKSNKWGNPQVLEKAHEINSNEWETSLVFGNADNVLYVVSDKEGGYGKRDIYKSVKMSDGVWGPMENLGPLINTEDDEDAPFITADGRFLYFSSTGHNSIGGFDIFKSENINNQWSEPKNLGYPINTSGNDLYFILDKENSKAYYSSSRAEQDVNNADMDIFSITLCDENPITVIKGLITSAEGGPIDMVISVEEKISQKQVARFIASRDGKYELNLLRNIDYIISFQGKKTEYFSQEITLPPQCHLYDLFQKVEISKRVDILKKQWVQKVFIKNAFFDINKNLKIAGFVKSNDQYENYLAYLNTINPKTTKLNYKEFVVETCLSDIYDFSDLTLTFYDSLNNNVETAALSKSGVFVFNHSKMDKNGVFRLNGQDPEADYQVNVAIGMDTVRTVKVGNEFVLPKTRLIAYNLQGSITESAIQNNKGGFVFRKVDLQQPGYFKLEKGDENANYEVKISQRGRPVVMQYQHGILYPFKKLSFYDFENNLVETSLLYKDSTFSFQKVNPGETGIFKLDGEEQDSITYGIKIMKNNTLAQRLQFQNGTVFSRRFLGFYNPQDDIVEMALMHRDRTFTFSKVKLDEAGIFKIHGMEADSINRMNVKVENISKDLVRTKNGFVYMDKLNSLQSDSLNIINAKLLAAQQVEFNREINAEQEKQRLALESLMADNALKFQQQVTEKQLENAVVTFDTIPLFPLRKLRLYDPEGAIVETAKLTTGGVFVFKKPFNEFGLFKLEGEEADINLPYEIKVVKGDSSIHSLKFSDMQIDADYLFPKKKLDFYNSKGEVLETATLNKQGIFVFHKLSGDEKGLFRLQEKDPAVYGINIMKGSQIMREVQIQNENIFPRKTLTLYNSHGEIAETSTADAEGNFVFHKKNTNDFELFKLDGKTDPSQDYTIKIIGAKGNVESLKLREMQVQEEYIFEKKQLGFYDDKNVLIETASVNKNKTFVFHQINVQQAGAFKMSNANPDSTLYYINLVNNNETDNTRLFQNGKLSFKKTLSLYDIQGKIVETVAVGTDGKFVFHKLAPDAFGIFKFDGSTGTNNNYVIEAIHDGAPIRTMNIKDMKVEEGFILPKKQINYYDGKGEFIESAELNRNGEFVFHKINAVADGLFKMNATEPDLAAYKIKLMKDQRLNQTVQYKEGFTFPQKTLRFYNTKGLAVDSAVLNKEGKFVFNKLSYDEPGSYKFDDNDELIGSKENYQIDIVHDGFTMRTIRLKDMDRQEGAFVPKKKLNYYNNEGIFVETASLNKEGVFVFHKISPDENGLFRLEGGEDAKLNPDYTIHELGTDNSVKELKFKNMRSEDGYVFEDKKLNFYNAQGNVIETASINKEGGFNFYKLKPDEIGVFKMAGMEQDKQLYEINIIKPDASKKTLQYQDGVAFPESYLGFFNAKGKLIETAKLNKEGEFVFHKLSPEDKGSFKLKGENQDATYLNNLKIIASNKPIEILMIKDSIVRVDELKDAKLVALDIKDSVKYSGVKNDLTSLIDNYSTSKSALISSAESTSKSNSLKMEELKKQLLLNQEPVKRAMVEKEIVMINKKDAILKADLMQKLNVVNKSYIDKKAFLASSALSLVEKNIAAQKAARANAEKEAIAKNDLALQSAKEEQRKKMQEEKQALSLAAKNDSIKKADIVKEVLAALARKESKGGLNSVSAKNNINVTAKNNVVNRDASESALSATYPHILFGYNESKVQEEYWQELNDIIKQHKGNFKYSIEIAGYTDSRGNVNYNLALSSRRVKSVVSFLVKGGISRKHIITREMGKSNPVASNENPDGSDNPEGRKLNRRVEIKIKD